ncbi:polysaccharide deacetylase family protein [Okeania sp.]|uniref:polysaccharide deacetylase family protein n=1 Tax=Okeania sp. TaxID=3100323 RepID=UPI002B4AF679|nr:polysaccharide deacetylase family protein [Okeania sp.]MEB3339418.1 polysaccharide deacetylase family protein [Okeania sp.]
MTNLGLDILPRKGKPLATIIAASGSFFIGILLAINILANQQPTVTTKNKIDNQENQLKTIKISSIVAQNIQTTRQKLRELELKTFNFSVPKRFEGETVRNITLKNQQKVIALTFDDGPWDKTTEQILDILKKNEIQATFFVIGKHLKERQEIGKKIVEAGHIIANHTWNHPSQSNKMSPDRIKSEIGRTAKLIYEVTGRTTHLFRPPAGVLENGLVDYAQERKHSVVLWSADSKDWYERSVEQVTKNVLEKASNGGIVLLHDGGGPRDHVVEALPDIIAGLKQQDYEFVTIPELLTMKDKELSKQEH